MENLPWVEKYRPLKLKNIYGQDKIIEILKKMILNNSIPHLLFYGKAGVGKTSTIISFCREIYGDDYPYFVLELNASDDRGIDIVRQEIKEFAELSKNSNKVKLIILDEADAMTYDAQFALRRIIEKYSNTTRFCFICNYLNKIIPAIKSRCTLFRFNPIDNISSNKLINKIIKKENIKCNKDIIDNILWLNQGDFRKNLNLIQAISLTPNINKNYQNFGIISKNSIINLINSLYTQSFNHNYHLINQLIFDFGIDFDNMLKLIIFQMIELNQLNTDIIIQLADLDYKYNHGNNDYLYFASLISIFTIYK
jgi:replication factor C subunit 3/5